MASDLQPFEHVPVLMDPVLQLLQPAGGQVVLDGTVGGAGHGSRLAVCLGPDGHYLGFDRDLTALATARQRLAGMQADIRLTHSNFNQAAELARQAGFAQGDAVLLDLGVSSPQLDWPQRGFSYHNDGPLDMRMDQSCGQTAADLVNTAPVEELARVLREYGEERYAHRIAAALVRSRQQQPFTTTLQLAQAVAAAMPPQARREEQHPARRTFQALRIAVNDELGGLGAAIESLTRWLKPGGRIGVISFHSLEDRIVKQTFARLYRPCTCPPSAPVCICGKRPVIQKPLPSQTASPQELQANPRSRSARLRGAIRV